MSNYTTIQLNKEIQIPKNTNVISNDGVTLLLAKKLPNDLYDIFIKKVDVLNPMDIFDSELWIVISKKELEKIITL